MGKKKIPKIVPKTNKLLLHHLFIIFLYPTLVLVTVTKSALDSEVILKCTAQKKINVITGRSMRKPFRGQLEGACDALNFSHHFSQCRRRLVGVIETENDALMCDYCTCLQIYSYPVVHSDISTTRVVLHSTQKTRASHHVQESCQCIFAALCFHQINPRECCYQIELVKLGCYKKNKTKVINFFMLFFSTSE